MREPFEYKGISFPSTELLTQSAIDDLIAVLRSIPSNDGLAYRQIVKMCNDVDAAKYDEAKEIAALRIIEWFASAKRREQFIGTRVDYRTYEIGATSHFDVPILICPACGLPGEVNPPYQGSDRGHTMHIVEPFFMGATVLESCEWPADLWRVER